MASTTLVGLADELSLSIDTVVVAGPEEAAGLGTVDVELVMLAVRAAAATENGRLCGRGATLRGCPKFRETCSRGCTTPPLSVVSMATTPSCGAAMLSRKETCVVSSDAVSIASPSSKQLGG